MHFDTVAIIGLYIDKKLNLPLVYHTGDGIHSQDMYIVVYSVDYF